ncbi:TPA: DNA-directed RNA polymerase subunit L [Candidatus Woesearchaeota archaeon]|nr:DNA-directed RNA polymerase subunit L [Candidatus Woesearchaeota archaeon]
MEINVLEEEKDRFVVEITGESHGFVNALKNELNRSKDVKAAGYRISHPLVGVPKLIIHGKDGRKQLTEAAKTLKKQSDDFLKAFQKAVK